MNQKNHLIGTFCVVTSPMMYGKLLIKDDNRYFHVQNTNKKARAMHGDVVEVEVMMEANKQNEQKKQQSKNVARIVRIVQDKKPKYLIGTFMLNSRETDDPKKILFRPRNKKFPLILIQKTQIPKNILQDEKLFLESLVIIKSIRWGEKRLPEAKIHRIIGIVGDLKAEQIGILIEHSVVEEFPESILERYERGKSRPQLRITDEEISKRKDLRDIQVFTVDPEGAGDLDDAVHCRRLNSYTLEVGVHIADVSFFVEPNSKLDVEARHRATSVYLVDRCIPMLPKILSECLCSLSAGEDKFAYSVIWNFSFLRKSNSQQNSRKEYLDIDECLSSVSKDFFENVNIFISSQWVGRSIIKPCVNLSYNKAQELLDGKIEPFDSSLIPVAKSLTELNFLSKLLRKIRQLSGARIESPENELNFVLDQSGNPLDVHRKVTLDAHLLVESLMVLANQTIAMIIFKSFPKNSILRRHPPPDLNQVQIVAQLCNDLGLTVDSSSLKSFHDSLLVLQKNLDPQIFNIIQQRLISSQSSAEYISTGDPELETDNFRHYDLNAQVYTHFTSPIRRYIDITVHKLLTASLSGLKLSKNNSIQEDILSLNLVPSNIGLKIICNHCNIKN
ncbi:dis3-like exonuclease 2 [Anaeramoeba ignava]|uniref:Dis3-like exonuclease 2 n=1 Tax=Anaeramoeba ignava TaxID=1746090 RepID=A0A9Q0LVD1_ANAIG|nr:dis3-like exonuclease 2 [Anaeramoeba ignava]